MSQVMDNALARPLENFGPVDSAFEQGFPLSVHRKVTGFHLWFSTRQACSDTGMNYIVGIR